MTNLHPSLRWLLISLLYLSQGIPLGLAMDALPSILKQQGASLEHLIFLPFVGLPWVLKFLWASQVDNHYSATLGRRRSWLIPMQSILLLCLISVACIGIHPASSAWVIALAVIASLASATQDIATDAMASENFDTTQLSKVNAIQVGGTMVGFFIGGAGVMIFSGYWGISTALLLPILIISTSLILLILSREKTLARTAPSTSSTSALKLRQQRHASLKLFFQRSGSRSLLLMAAFSAIAMVSSFGLGKLVLIDHAWSITQVGQLGMLGGATTILLGCGGGAILLRFFAIKTMFMFGILISIFAATIWLMLLQQTQISFLPALSATMLGCFGAGCASVALMTQAMRFAQQGLQAGTDMTCVQSARDIGEMLMSSSLLSLSAALGYGAGFSLGIIAAMVAIVVVMLAPISSK